MKILVDTDTRTLSFEEGATETSYPLYSRESFEVLSREWVRVGWSQAHFTTFSWLGLPFCQLPDDVLRIQEVIARLRPDVIVETGIFGGGSLLFYASLCKVLGHGQVIGVDITIPSEVRRNINNHLLAPWITMIEGNSVDPAVVAQVRQQIGANAVVLVILDSDHSKAHVAAELEAYAPLVSPGSYIIAADGLMADLTNIPAIPEDWAWNNPATAALEFVAAHLEFAIQPPPWLSNLSTLTENVTHWPHGWLLRLSGPTTERLPLGNDHHEHHASQTHLAISPRQIPTKYIPADSAAGRYLELLKNTLTDMIHIDLDPHGDVVARREGRDFPITAHTLVGLKRLDNLQRCIEDVLANNVPGDLSETGVWRGGASIFMRAVLSVHGIQSRRLWLADSFAGLPPPDPAQYVADTGMDFHLFPVLAVTLEQVQANFERYGLFDDQVTFLKGWFRDTLPTAPIEQLAILRLDGDLYESTMDALVHLYPKLAPGGYVIVDDYGALPPCQQAVHDYREAHGITAPIMRIDWTGVYWQRPR
jgi:cephalosporin hydroxylase